MSEAILRFTALLRASAKGRTRLALPGIMQAFLRWRPEMATDSRKREVLAAALEELSQAGVLALPRGMTSFDRSARPPLPSWVALVSAQETPQAAAFDHRTYPWVPEMAFVPAMAHLPNPDDAVAINEFFRNGGAMRPIVPIKERSYTIFGYEKRLEEVMGSRSLGYGLSLELLRCHVVEQIPVHLTNSQAATPDALVLENEAAFDSFARWNRSNSRFRWIVYGRGNDVLKSAGFLRELQREHGGTYYFGDLDPHGVWIPHELSRKLLAAGGSAVRPLVGAYQLLAAKPGQQVRFDEEGSSNGGAGAVEWLPAGVRAVVSDLFARGRRLPQEALGWEMIAGETADDLLGTPNPA